jgi:hypothetical protein
MMPQGPEGLEVAFFVVAVPVIPPSIPQENPEFLVYWP